MKINNKDLYLKIRKLSYDYIDFFLDYQHNFRKQVAHWFFAIIIAALFINTSFDNTSNGSGLIFYLLFIFGMIGIIPIFLLDMQQFQLFIGIFSHIAKISEQNNFITSKTQEDLKRDTKRTFSDVVNTFYLLLLFVLFVIAMVFLVNELLNQQNKIYLFIAIFVHVIFFVLFFKGIRRKVLQNKTIQKYFFSQSQNIPSNKLKNCAREWKIYKGLNTRFQNNILWVNDIRQNVSRVIFATYISIGWILSSTHSFMHTHKMLIVSLLTIGGLCILYMIWSLDFLVSQKRVKVVIKEMLKLETRNKWIPQIAKNIILVTKASMINAPLLVYMIYAFFLWSTLITSAIIGFTYYSKWLSILFGITTIAACLFVYIWTFNKSTSTSILSLRSKKVDEKK